MRKLLIVLVISVLTLSTACEEFLTEIPQGSYADGVVYQSERDLRLLVNGLYRTVNGVTTNGSGYNIQNEVTYQNFVDDAYNRLGNRSTDLDFTPTSQVVNVEYGSRYRAIRFCNEFITRAQGVEDVKPDVLTSYLAQARFIRAYHYDRLNFVFGDVPLVLDLIEFTDLPKRDNKNKVFDFVTEELTEISTQLPWETNEPGRITKGAALGLLARHLLNGLSWYGDDAKLYALAKEACKQIYDEGPYSLASGVDGYKDLFELKRNDATNPEVMWLRLYDREVNTHAHARMMLPKGAFSGTRANNSAYIGATNKLVEAFQMNNGKSIHDPTSGYDPASPWENRDPRLDITILRTGEVLPIVGGEATKNFYILDPHPTRIPEDTVADLKGIANDNIGGTVNKTGYYFQKYMHFEFLSSQEDFFDYIMMRYAEVVLMYAEALVGESAANIAQAMSLVNEVRARVNMPTVEDTYGTVPDQQQAIDIILLERRFELATEGPHRWFDIKRYRLGEKVFVNGTDPGDGPEVYGIPFGPNRNPDQNVLEGDLRDDVKTLCGTRQFNPDTYYWWPIPQGAIDVNPMLKEDSLN